MKCKKVFCFALVFLLMCTALPLAALAVGSPGDYLVDDAQLLTAEQQTTLAQQLADVSEQLRFTVAVVTVTDMQGDSAMTFADNYYDENGYGCGENRDGCLLLVHMDANRGYRISTSGYGITALSDFDIQYIGEEMVPYLSAGEYYSAFVLFADSVQQLVSYAQSDSTEGYADDTENYTVTTRRASLYTEDLLLGVIFGLVVALITVGSLKGQLKTVKRRNAAADYFVDGSLQLTGSYDRLMGRHLSRVRLEQDHPAGGGSSHTGSHHTGSSGRAHGGGGGHF